MTVLTDDEARALSQLSEDTLEVIRETERAVIAKLGADVTLPEPKFACERAADGVQGTHFYEVTNPRHVPVWAALYTADQLRAAYAAGAATRLGADNAGDKPPQGGLD